MKPFYITTNEIYRVRICELTNRMSGSDFFPTRMTRAVPFYLDLCFQPMVMALYQGPALGWGGGASIWVGAYSQKDRPTRIPGSCTLLLYFFFRCKFFLFCYEWELWNKNLRINQPNVRPLIIFIRKNWRCPSIWTAASGKGVDVLISGTCPWIGRGAFN